MTLLDARTAFFLAAEDAGTAEALIVDKVPRAVLLSIWKDPCCYYLLQECMLISLLNCTVRV